MSKGDGGERLDPHGRARRALVGGALASTLLQDTPEKLPTGGWEERDQAEVDMGPNGPGITVHQRLGYMPGISDALARGYIPNRYNPPTQDELEGVLRDATKAARQIGMGFVRDVNQEYLDELHERYNLAENEVERRRALHNLQDAMRSLDAWRLYVRMPQLRGTFTISKYQPSIRKENRYYYSFRDFPSLLNVEPSGTRSAIRYILETIRLQEDAVSTYPDNPEGVRLPDGTWAAMYDFTMGNYRVGKDDDEHGSYIWYYDVWNLGRSAEGEQGILGQPFEIYDRIYYDSETFEPLNPQPAS